MARGNDAGQQRPRRLAQLIMAAIFAVGLVAAIVLGVLMLSATEIPAGLFIGFLFGYSFAALGLGGLVIASTTRNAEPTSYRTSTATRAGRGAGILLSVDSPIPAAVFGAAALLLAVLLLVRREALDTMPLAVGAFVVVIIGYWGFQAYRNYRK